MKLQRLTYDTNGHLLSEDWSRTFTANDSSWTTGTPTLNSGTDAALECTRTAFFGFDASVGTNKIKG